MHFPRQGTVDPEERLWTGPRGWRLQPERREDWPLFTTHARRLNSPTVTSSPQTSSLINVVAHEFPTLVSPSLPLQRLHPDQMATVPLKYWTAERAPRSLMCILLGCFCWSCSQESALPWWRTVGLGLGTEEWWIFHGGCSRWWERNGQRRCLIWSWWGTRISRRRWLDCCRLQWRALPLHQINDPRWATWWKWSRRYVGWRCPPPMKPSTPCRTHPPFQRTHAEWASDP